MKNRFLKLLSFLVAFICCCCCTTVVFAQENDANIPAEDEEVIVIDDDDQETPENVSKEDSEEPATKEIITTIKSDVKTTVYDLPEIIMKEVKRQLNNYPGIKIGVGIYSLDGSIGYEYNADTEISGGCTVKAYYALYVLIECEEQGIDIWKETITYRSSMWHGGSGIIRYDPYGTEYTISYLLEKLLDISGNTAYFILMSNFPLSGFRKFLKEIGGQQLSKGQQYGEASVIQRKNEWLAIYKYITSASLYSDALRGFLTNTEYCYLVKMMEGNHTYMHKSGWSSFTKKSKYSSACDCGIIDENYLLIVMTEDYETGKSHSRAVKKIGLSVEKYANSLNKDGLIF